MYQKLFIPLFLLLFTFPLLAIDINETTEIIKEASEATQNLQKDFSALMEEETIPAVVDMESSTPSDNNVTAQEVFIVKDINSSNTTNLQEPIQFQKDKNH